MRHPRRFVTMAVGAALLALVAGCRSKDTGRPSTDPATGDREAMDAPVMERTPPPSVRRAPSRQAPSVRTRPALDPDPPASVLPPEAQLPADAVAQLQRKRYLAFPSRWNGQVHVRQRGHHRSMYLGKRLDIVHTRLDMRRPAELISPYQRCLLVGLGLFRDPAKQLRRAVIVGLGGGAITRFFHLKRPKLVFHSVEIDPMVVAVARRFFDVRDTATYRSYALDGRRFLEEARRPYDLVIMDAFDAKAAYPKQLASVEFFRLVKRRLTPGGVLIMNFLVHSRRVYADVFKTLRQVFPSAVQLSLRTFESFNVLILAAADPRLQPTTAQLRERVRAIAERWGVRFPLRRCVDAIGADRPDLARARIIRDPEK